MRRRLDGRDILATLSHPRFFQARSALACYFPSLELSFCTHYASQNCGRGARGTREAGGDSRAPAEAYQRDARTTAEVCKGRRRPEGA